MDQAERESVAIVLKNNITASYLDRMVAAEMSASGMSDADLLAFMNDQSQHITQRRIAALALAKDPNSITPQPSAPKQSPSPAPNNPIKNQGIVMNPDVMKDIARLSPRAPVAAPPKAASAPEPSPRAASTFGEGKPTARIAADVLNREEAREVLDYALMARDSYENPNSSAFAPAGYRRDTKNWWDYLKNAGLSPADMRTLEEQGFSATVYRKDMSNEIVIAFRGTEGRGDVSTNITSSVGIPTVQSLAAVKLVEEVQKQGAPVILTGHSLGAALATYAGNANNLKVITFNGARPPSAIQSDNPNQTNFVVEGDIIGDKKSALGFWVGVGSLPGRTLSVQSSTDQSGVWGATLGRHGIDGIIGGLSDIARKK